MKMWCLLVDLPGKIDNGEDTWPSIIIPAGTKMQGLIQEDATIHNLSGPLWSEVWRVHRDCREPLRVGVHIVECEATEQERAGYESAVRERLSRIFGAVGFRPA